MLTRGRGRALEYLLYRYFASRNRRGMTHQIPPAIQLWSGSGAPQVTWSVPGVHPLLYNAVAVGLPDPLPSTERQEESMLGSTKGGRQRWTSPRRAVAAQRGETLPPKLVDLTAGTCNQHVTAAETRCGTKASGGRSAPAVGLEPTTGGPALRGVSGGIAGGYGFRYAAAMSRGMSP